MNKLSKTLRWLVWVAALGGIANMVILTSFVGETITIDATSLLVAQGLAALWVIIAVLVFLRVKR